MTARGMARKFDTEAYIRKVSPELTTPQPRQVGFMEPREREP
jgi:hypothetical protein